jgi:23S rRNA pseudouridine1911/1915/1917 synthase
LVHGELEPKEGEINAPIERSPVNRMHFGVFPGGREATTKYKVIKFVKFLKYPKETYSYLEVEPKTGRTHQIRVHMKYLGHSVVSDPLYAGRKQLIRDLTICPRMFLHATHLEISGLVFDSPLPMDLNLVLKSIE